jgi:hypothetical protein
LHLEQHSAGERSREIRIPRKCTCQPGRLAVVSDLPIKRLTRATRRASQFASNGQSALAAEQGSFAALFITSSGTSGGNSHRKGITRGKHRPHRIDLREPEGAFVRLLRRGRSRKAVGLLAGLVANCAERFLRRFAGCLLVTRSQAGVFPARLRTGGRQRKFSSSKKAAERKNAMHQTAHCQEVHA